MLKPRNIMIVVVCLVVIGLAVVYLPGQNASAKILAESLRPIVGIMEGGLAPTSAAPNDVKPFDNPGTNPDFIVSGTYIPQKIFKLWLPNMVQAGGSKTIVIPTPPTGKFTKENMVKGPDLIYTGSNTVMKIFWQWTTNVSFQLEWGVSPSFSTGSATVSTYDSTNHLYAYTITGLTPNQKYEYRVIIGSQSSAGSFLTAPSDSATSLKFVSYGDTRSNPNLHDAVAAQVVALFQSDPAYQTISLNVGDLVADGNTNSLWDSEYFSPIFTNIRTEMANMSVLPVMGNHEGSGDLLQRYFPMPFVSARYWSFDYGPAHFVMLDQYTAYTTGTAQFNWLQSDLAATNKKWKIVVLHEPGWSANGGHPNNTFVQNQLEPLFEKYGVALVLAGHNHYYARAVVNGIQHLTIGTGGAPTYSPTIGQPNIVKTYQGTGFNKFEINGSTLTSWFLNNKGVVQDTFTLTR